MIDATYYLIGGVYTDTTFRHIEPGTSEVHGPYTSYEDAEKAWRGKMGWKVDICCHRLFIQLAWR